MERFALGLDRGRELAQRAELRRALEQRRVLRRRPSWTGGGTQLSEDVHRGLFAARAAAAAAAANAAAAVTSAFGFCTATGSLGAAGPAPLACASAFVVPGEVLISPPGDWI